MTNKLFKSAFIVLASESARTFFDGDRVCIQEFLNEFEDGKVYLEDTSLSIEEFNLLSNKEQVDVALVDEDGHHIFFPRVQPFQAKWMFEKLNEEEYMRVYKTSDAITVADFRKLEKAERGIKAFGDRVWFCLLNVYQEFEYDIHPSIDSDIFLKIDLQSPFADSVALDKEELLADAIGLLNDRIECNAEYDDLVKCLEEQKKPLEEALSSLSLDDKMIDLLGADVWNILKSNLILADYKLRILSENEFGLIDVCYDKTDERFLSRIELLQFLKDDIADRMDYCGYISKEDRALNTKVLSVLNECIAMEEIETHRTRAINLESHMTNKRVGAILDEWLDMKSYTVYKDEFNQLYYVDEIACNGQDRSEYIKPTTLHDIVKLIINEMEEAMQDDLFMDAHSDEEIEYLYRSDLRILKAYARW